MCVCIKWDFVLFQNFFLVIYLRMDTKVIKLHILSVLLPKHDKMTQYWSNNFRYAMF